MVSTKTLFLSALSVVAVTANYYEPEPNHAAPAPAHKPYGYHHAAPEPAHKPYGYHHAAPAPEHKGYGYSHHAAPEPDHKPAYYPYGNGSHPSPAEYTTKTYYKTCVETDAYNHLHTVVYATATKVYPVSVPYGTGAAPEPIAAQPSGYSPSPAPYGAPAPAAAPAPYATGSGAPVAPYSTGAYPAPTYAASGAGALKAAGVGATLVAMVAMLF